MSSLFSKLFDTFAGKSGRKTEVSRGNQVSYEGLTIQAAPEPVGDHWRLAGFITKQDEESSVERKFLRADIFSSRNEAMEFAIRKGRQIIDEQGSRLFADGKPHGRI